MFPNRVHAGITDGLGIEMKYPDQAALVGLHSLYIAMHDDHISPQLGEKTVSTRMLKSIPYSLGTQANPFWSTC